MTNVPVCYTAVMTISSLWMVNGVCFFIWMNSLNFKCDFRQWFSFDGSTHAQYKNFHYVIRNFLFLLPHVYMCVCVFVVCTCTRMYICAIVVWYYICTIYFIDNNIHKSLLSVMDMKAHTHPHTHRSTHPHRHFSFLIASFIYK